jgi:Flp pilus assembly protein TadG
MAIKGSKSKNTSAKGTTGNPTRTKVKTKRISPKTQSKFKNQLTKETSKATLKAVRENTSGTGAKSVQGLVPTVVLKKNLNSPRIKILPGTLTEPRLRSKAAKVTYKKGKY